LGTNDHFGLMARVFSAFIRGCIQVWAELFAADGEAGSTGQQPRMRQTDAPPPLRTRRFLGLLGVPRLPGDEPLRGEGRPALVCADRVLPVGE